MPLSFMSFYHGVTKYVDKNSLLREVPIIAQTGSLCGRRNMQSVADHCLRIAYDSVAWVYEVRPRASTVTQTGRWRRAGTLLCSRSLTDPGNYSCDERCTGFVLVKQRHLFNTWTESYDVTHYRKFVDCG